MKNFLSHLLENLGKMSLKKHIFYWILPFTILGILMIFYFSGIPELVEFVCPKENWEWGILENIQLGIIFCMFIISLYASWTKKLRIQKIFFFLVSIFSIFVFLEEIDYGAHFAELIGGAQEIEIKKIIPSKNLHNQGNNAKIFKRSVYGIMALIFVIAPFQDEKIKNVYLKYLIPKPRIVIVAVLAIIVDLVPRLIVEFGILEDGGLGVNIGEFSEIIVYYIFLIYLTQLIFINKLETGKS
jgi:hypothetical protein